MRRADRCLLVAGLLALTIAGCGGGGEEPGSTSAEATPSAPVAERGEDGEVVVAALGDSITAGNPAYDPDPEQRAELGFGSDERSQYEYWAERANPKASLRNCGVFGERTDEIAERLGECAEGADVLIVQGGINDIAQALGGGEQAALEATGEAAENLQAMVREGKEMGLVVFIADVLPWNNGYPYAQPAIRALNREIRRIAGEEGVPVLPFNATLEDPRKPGLMADELTADGDHPSIEGYRLLGEKGLPGNLEPRPGGGVGFSLTQD